MHHQRSRSAESCCSWRGTTQDRSPELEHLDSFNDESEDSSPHPPFFHDSGTRDLHIRHESASSHNDCELSDTDTPVSSRQLREYHFDEEFSPPSSPLRGDDATASSPELPQSASTANQMWASFDADETLPLPGSSSAWHDGGTPPSHRPRPGSRAAQFQGSHTPSRQASRRLRVDSPGETCNEDYGPTAAKRHLSNQRMTVRKKLIRAASLVNFTLFSGGDVHSIADQGVQRYLRDLIPLEELPTEEDCDAVLAHQLSQVSLHQNENSVLGLGLVARKNNNCVDLLCFTITRNGRFSYISHKSVTSEQESYQDALGEFIGKAIDITLEYFKVRVNLVLFKGEAQPLPGINMHDDVPYYVIYDFNNLLKQLYGRTTDVLTTEFMNQLQLLSKLIQNEKTTLPCLTDFLVRFVSDSDAKHEPWSRPIMDCF
ncbi:hypothetical protein QAD02_008337 [Eretmocerus hayati]|uniref:Uncharacterized protein n=1 Tax=Eretmocerus hayati TaxID=131215 RepID=A0ACC2NAK7_9HYME|nr:hypothetical protein QAD02_008337 [Eretmocerus hayati]